MNSWETDLIKLNKYTRPGKKLKGVKKIVLHWTANPGASAKNHQTYFGVTLVALNKERESKGQEPIFASAHIFVDKNGAKLIIPLNELAYHANDIQKYNKDKSAYRGIEELKPNANYLSIGVEMCVEKDGTISPITLKNTVNVIAELCNTYKLTEKDIVRHFDVTSKNCPAPFVADDQLFIEFKKTVKSQLKTNCKNNTETVTPVKNTVKPKSPVYPGTLLEKGSKGEFVELVQSKLKIKVDGIFGSLTEAAVRKFQKLNGLKVDGIIGKLTWNKMFN